MPDSVMLPVDAAALRPLFVALIRETLAQIEDQRAAMGDRLAFGEREAAALLGLKAHQLRDTRLRREISASRGPGNRIMYTRQQLTEFLASRPWDKEKPASNANR